MGTNIDLWVDSKKQICHKWLFIAETLKFDNSIKLSLGVCLFELDFGIIV